jgi:uncharacterized membrane protein YfcA
MPEERLDECVERTIREAGFELGVAVHVDSPRLDLDWQTLLIVTVLGILGSYIGARYARKMPQDKLERWFGYFLILMGLYILARSAPEVMGLMI